MSATPSHSRRNSAAASRSPTKAQRTPVATGSAKRYKEDDEQSTAAGGWYPGSSVSATPFRASQGYRNPLSASQMSMGGASTMNNPVVPMVPMDTLDFSVMYNKIENFMVTFNAFISGEIAATEMLREEHDSGIALDKEEIKGLEGEVEDAKKDQSKLWDTIKQQKEADSTERADIAKLKGTQSSLTSKRANLEQQLNDLAGLSASKRKAQDEKKSMLHMQRSKNQVELGKLRDLTGLKVAPTKIPGQLRVAYELINPDDFYDEYSFILDLADAGNGKQYNIIDCQPQLRPGRQAELNTQLAKTRDPWEIIKAMRTEFKVVAEEARKKRRGLA